MGECDESECEGDVKGVNVGVWGKCGCEGGGGEGVSVGEYEVKGSEGSEWVSLVRLSEGV